MSSAFLSSITTEVKRIADQTAEVATKVVAQGVQSFGDRAVTEANKLKEKMLNDGQTNDECNTFSSLWEMPEPLDNCRGCEKKFTTRKHHCRSCAGVFCDDCSPVVTPTSEFEQDLVPATLNIPVGQPVRICHGCRRGECPSRAIIELCRKRLDDQVKRSTAQSGIAVRTTLEKLQHKMALKVSEVVGKIAEDDPNFHLGLFQIKLHRGSYYGENGLVRKAGTSRAAAMSGYFEIFNKSSTVAAFKLMRSTDNALFELPRPSYISVVPGDAVYAFFDVNNVSSMDLIVLHDNPNDMHGDSAILYDTRAHGAYPERISPCARIGAHRKAAVYTIQCQSQNVVLKYKDKGVVLPRRGNSAQRVGVFGWVQNRRHAESLIDLNSNVTSDDVAPNLAISVAPPS